MTIKETNHWGHPTPEDVARYIEYLPTLAEAIDNIGIGIYQIAVTVGVLAAEFHIVVQNEDAGLAVVIYLQNDQFSRMWSFFGPQLEENEWTFIHSDDPELVGNGPWFQFHYDRFTVPPGAKEIARNPVAPQAFTINKSLGVQFHPELDSAALKGWLDEGGTPQVIKDNQDPEVMLAQTRAEDAAGEKRTYELIDAFLTRVAKLV